MSGAEVFVLLIAAALALYMLYALFFGEDL